MLYGANVVIFEGIMSFFSKDIRNVSEISEIIEIHLFIFEISKDSRYENICRYRCRYSSCTST